MADYLADRDGLLVPVQDTGTELTGRAADPPAKPARAYGPTHCLACSQPLAARCACSIRARMLAVRKLNEGNTGRGKRQKRKAAQR
jgi:hypothetical protein